MTKDETIKYLENALYGTKRSCDNCGFIDCECFQRQRKNEACDRHQTFQERIKVLEKLIKE